MSKARLYAHVRGLSCGKDLLNSPFVHSCYSCVGSRSTLVVDLYCLIETSVGSNLNYCSNKSFSSGMTEASTMAGDS